MTDDTPDAPGERTDTKLCIDLFAGLGGFSQAFEEHPDWEVVTVELEERFDPDIQADILDLRYDDLPAAPDLILASPPCTGFSVGSIGSHWTDKQPDSDTARTGIQLAHHTRGLIQALNPDHYVIENPRGMMRHVLGEPTGTVWFCQYGSNRAKPTDLWADLPDSFEYKQCANGNRECHHEPAPRGSDTGTQSNTLTPAERARIPEALSRAILHAVEFPDPAVHEQQNLEVFS